MRLLWAVRQHIPDAHLIKLGSFGNTRKRVEIAEGYFQPEFNGRIAIKPMPYPENRMTSITSRKSTIVISFPCPAGNGISGLRM